MLKNYLKVALKVFWRHKFFTGVNLFGICFTLVVLMLAAAFIDQETGPIPPEVHSDRTLHLGWLTVQHDSSDPPRRRGITRPGYAFLDRYVRPLRTAENVTVFSNADYRGHQGGAEEGYVSVRMTDAAYWEVFRFDFIQGRPYGAEEVEAGDFVAVISSGFGRRFFGSEAVVGRSVPIDGQNFRVVGVADVRATRRRHSGEVWVPVTTAPPETWRTYKLRGEFKAAVLAARQEDMERIRGELAAVMKQVEPPPGEPSNLIAVSAPLFTTWEEWACEAKSDCMDDYEEGEDPQQAAADRLRWWLLTLGSYLLLFMLLPALHLVNLNIGRIEERTSEIGVRKSFGASTGTLVGQFVVENVLLTLIGAGLSLPLSWGILALVSLGGVTYMDAGVMIRTFLYGVFLALFFGTISGAWPAWKMARLHPVKALTGRREG